jgi:8-hydroxy-5-deazaflavin:NADPH oxidoreductase
MDAKDVFNPGRRRILMSITAGLLLGLPLKPRTAGMDRESIRIGTIGAGKIGGTLGALWAKAGHEVLLSSRHPDQLKELADRLGPKARVGFPQEAAAFGEVVY